MFEWIATVVTKLWWLIICLWVAALAVAVTTRPEWNSVATDGELQHLPADSPTRLGDALYQEAFPEDITDSSIVLIVHRDPGQLTQQDEAFILEELVPAIRDIADAQGGVLREQQSPEGLARAFLERMELEDELGPLIPAEEAPSQPETSDNPNNRSENPNDTAADPGDGPRVVSIASVGNFLIGPMLRSADGQATLVAMNLTSGFLKTQNTEIAQQVQQAVEDLRASETIPQGLQISLTGSTMIGVDTIEAVTESTQAVRKWATWLVLGMLLLVYRAPVSAVLPLATMYVAVEVTIALLAWAAYYQWIEVFDGLVLYVSVIVYGAGVDYSLFLVSRHREEMVAGATVKQAARTAISSTGIAVAASAGTEIIGIGLLGFAEFGKFQQAGIGIALGLCVLLVASLTLTPALLCCVGQWAYWPASLKKKQDRGREATQRAQQHPEQASEALVERGWRWIGNLQQHYPGRIWLGTLAVLSPLAIFGAFSIDDQTYDLTSSLPAETPSTQGLEVLGRHFSEGATGPITVLLRDAGTDFSSAAGLDKIQELTQKIEQYSDSLQIASIRSVADPLGTSERAQQLIQTIASIAPSIKFLDRGELIVDSQVALNDAEAVLQEFVREPAYRHYVSSTPPHAGQVTWLSLTPADDPYASESIARLDQLEKMITESMPASLEGAEVYLLGATASLRDVRDVARRDFRKIAVLIPVGVLLVLMVMLRKVVLPSYLILTVLLSFLVTIGATHALFWWLNPAEFSGLQWTVPVLLFVLLVAVGEDYSVLLVSRTDEEQQEHGPVKGITEALVRTGGLISGAGLIMAGTFSWLSIGGTLAGMHQLGFALTFGMLLDTFVVRPLLVPSFQHLMVKFRQRALGLQGQET